MFEFLETYNLPRLNHTEVKNLNRLIFSEDIKSVIKNLPKNKIPGSHSFNSEFYQTLKKKKNGKLFQKQRRKEHLHEASLTLIPVPDKNTIKEENYRPISLMDIDEKSSTKY